MLSGRICASLGLGLLLGGMLFFGAVMAPLVFTQLPLEVAGPFIRTAFPWYYGFCAALAALAWLGFLLRREPLAGLLPLAVLGLSLASLFWLLPHMDALRMADNKPGFAFWHQLSVWVNGAEMLALLLLFIRTAARRD